ncbi:MAG: cytochrome c [Gammaproteobacteria bacterium]|nr:cytochrome c [Gammaproteobacteria bacterium]
MPERALLLTVLLWASATGAEGLGLGHAPDAATLAAADTAIGPSGEELPPGRGSVDEGAALFAAQCAACHGATGREGPDPVLVGGQGTLATAKPEQTIGSYWPYATTVFDYIRRAMPFTRPGSLSDDQVYALTAFLLARNGILPQDTVLDRDGLRAVRMPNQDGFFPDPRPGAP